MSMSMLLTITKSVDAMSSACDVRASEKSGAGAVALRRNMQDSAGSSTAHCGGMECISQC